MYNSDLIESDWPDHVFFFFLSPFFLFHCALERTRTRREIEIEIERESEREREREIDGTLAFFVSCRVDSSIDKQIICSRKC